MKSKGLGKGLGALIAPDLSDAVLESGSEPSKADGERIYEIPLDKIDRYESQPRESFDDEALQELADSIKEHGLLQPIIVSTQGDRYRIVAGERRFRAAMLNKMSTIRAIVKTYDEKKTFELALIENIQRENLNAIEEAKALSELKTKYGMTLEQIAKTTGKNKTTVSNSMRLLKLPPEILSEVETGRISAGHARALLGLSDTLKMKQLANDIMENDLSVREVEQRVSDISEGNEKQKRARGKRSKDVEQIEKELSGLLDMKVVMQGSDEKGKMVFTYDEKAKANVLIEIIRSAFRKDDQNDFPEDLNEDL